MAVDMTGSLHDRWQWPIEQGREYIAMIWFRPDAAQLTLHVLYMMNYSVVLDDICLIFNQWDGQVYLLDRNDSFQTHYHKIRSFGYKNIFRISIVTSSYSVKLGL